MYISALLTLDTPQVVQFFSSRQFHEIETVPGAREALARLHSKYRFVAVTAREEGIKDETIRWLDLHFPGIIDDHVFCNLAVDHGVKRSKCDVCKEIGAVALIDDSLPYCQQARAEIPDAAFKVILFGRYAWNTGDVEPGIVRVADWSELTALLEAEQ